MNRYRVATIDLNNNICSEEIFSEELTRLYMGGGLGAYILNKRTSPQISALEPESVLCLLSGLLVKTGAPAASKLTFYARSPLTGIWGESTVGGHWPAKLRATGFNGIIIYGRAETPVLIRLEEDGAHIDSAVDVWGKDTFETYHVLNERYPKYAIASIGPAGERLLPIASVMADGRIARAAGRGGLGAVMGSKRVKAVIAFGKKQFEFYDRVGLRELLKTDVKSIAQNAERLREFGTAGGVLGAEEIGDMPLMNWKIRSWHEGAKKITAQTFFPEYLEKHHTCHSCPIRCGKILRQKSGVFAGSISHAPEYETIAGFGGCCLVDSAQAVINANEYCNRYGIDTISASATIAFAMEAFEKNIITDKDTGGKKILWGDGDIVLSLLEDMVDQKGIGKLLSKGVRYASKILGKGSNDFAVHVKGLEPALHDPRAFPSMAVSYALGSRGADHLEGMSYMYEKGLRIPGYGYQGELDRRNHKYKAQIAHENINYYSVFNALGLCKFISIGKASLEMISRWVSKATGWDVDQEELLTVGSRLTNVKRVYNLARGVTAADDILPLRMVQFRSGDCEDDGVIPEVEKMVKEVYQMRSWDKNGVPKPEELKKLGITNHFK